MGNANIPQTLIIIPERSELTVDPGYLWYLQKKNMQRPNVDVAVSRQLRSNYMHKSNGKATYVGFVNQSRKPHGFGCYIAGELKYEGQFSNGTADGDGTLTLVSEQNSALYQGHFENNKFKCGKKFTNFDGERFKTCEFVEQAASPELYIEM